MEDAGGDGDEEEEEDIEDPQEIIREKCRETKKCASLRDKLNTCNERVLSRKRTEETCEEELFDFVHCVDHCVSQMLTPFAHVSCHVVLPTFYRLPRRCFPSSSDDCLS